MEYVNDLPSVIQHCIPFMFADDTKHLRIIKEPNDAFLMQLDLNNLSAWSESSDLSFNQLKANLSICISGTIRLKLLYQQNKRDSTKDLGIILSNSLNWSDHYHSIAAKAYKILGLLRCCFKTDSVFVKKKLYISLVRSHLLDCSQIWWPYKIKDILLLERVWRCATKYILCDFTSNSHTNQDQ